MVTWTQAVFWSVWEACKPSTALTSWSTPYAFAFVWLLGLSMLDLCAQILCIVYSALALYTFHNFDDALDGAKAQGKKGWLEPAAVPIGITLKS